jgi:hypothetical protein
VLTYSAGEDGAHFIKGFEKFIILDVLGHVSDKHASFFTERVGLTGRDCVFTLKSLSIELRFIDDYSRIAH